MLIAGVVAADGGGGGGGGGFQFSNRCSIVLGRGRKSYFCQSTMAEPKVLQFVLLFPRGQ